MVFFELDLDARIKNFSKLTTDKEMIKIMSDEYAKLIHQPFELVYTKMLDETQKFRSKYDRRGTLKNKLLGTKKS